MEYWLECIGCGERYEKERIIYSCKKCGDILDVKYDYESFEEKAGKRAGIWRYLAYLPIDDEKKAISLNESGTSLYQCPKLSASFEVDLWVKNEGENPTGSFKDRGMSVGVTKALELNIRRVGCASTGNTSASLAAYSARAGIECIVLVPAGKIAFGKLAQALVYGAKVYTIKGSFDEAMKEMRKLAEEGKIYLLNSINPYRVEGQKTIAYEIIEEMRDVEYIFVPVGNAANISAIWKGIKEFKLFGKIEKLPKMIGVQASGASPLVNLFKKGGKLEPIQNPETIATAIRIGNPVSWKKALSAVKESNGEFLSVSDEEILEAQGLLAREEGIFVEPASATGIAGVKKLREEGKIEKNSKIVCVATGCGLKDPNIVVERYKENIKEIESLSEI